MNPYKALLLHCLIAWASHIVYAGKGEPERVRVVKAFRDRALSNLLKEAGELLGDLQDAKASSRAANSKLIELRTALTQPNNKSSQAILVPAGWDKKAIIDAINKALGNEKQLQELTDKFNRFMAQIEDLKSSQPGKNKIKVPSELLPPNAIFPKTLENSTVMGKLIGFIKTGRNLGSLQLSDLNPCSKGGCGDQWKKGIENLRSFLSKSPGRLSELFKNFATLRRISEEPAPPPVPIDSSKLKAVNKTKIISPKNHDATKQPVDYFDFYYHQEESSPRKGASPKNEKKNPKIGSLRKNVNSSSSSNNVLTKSETEGEYTDEYYQNGFPSIVFNRTTFTDGKVGGE